MGSRMVGNAPPEVKNTTEQSHSGKNVKVGVGSKAKEVFDKREGVGAVHDESESKTRPTGVVAKPDKELNTITSTENKRLRDHNTEMDKFLKGATPAQRREYTAIKNRKDGREDYDAQRKYARNITGKESKTQEKVTQTKEEKESERKLEYADRMVDMKERDKRIKRDAWKENEEFHKKIEEDEKTWQGKKEDKEDKKFHGTGKKEGKVSTIASKPKDKKPVPKDNPNALKPKKEESEPDKITTDDINDKISAIATQLAQIKDPKERAKKRLELSGQNEADKSKKEIEAAAKKVEAAKKKVEASKKKKETAKKKKVVPKGDQLTPAQIKAYRAERQAKKDTVAKSNEIITTMNIMKLDLMKKKDPNMEKFLKLHENYKPNMEKFGKDISEIPVTDKPKLSKEENDKIMDKMIGKSADETIFKAISLKLDLMKDSEDGKQSKDGLPKNGELKDLISGDDTREHVAEATRLGNEKRDIDEEFKKRYGFKNTPKNWKHFGRKNRMSGGTKESLKSDLMKDGAMMTQHRQGNMKRRVGQRGGRSDYQHEQRSGSLARNEPQTREGQADDSTQPRVQLGHSVYTPTHEVENPWVKEPRSAGENTSIYEYNLDQHKPDKLHGTIPKGGKAPDNVGDNKPQKSKEIKAGEPEEPQLAGGVIPKGGNSPKGMKVKKSAEETIFKAISLKLDLTKTLK